MRLLLKALLLLAASTVFVAGGVMPTVFTADEARFDTYAAGLAATEELRRGTSDPDACDKVLKGLGTSLDEYNRIGKQVLKNEALKQRASYYLLPVPEHTVN